MSLATLVASYNSHKSIEHLIKFSIRIHYRIKYCDILVVSSPENVAMMSLQ